MRNNALESWYITEECSFWKTQCCQKKKPGEETNSIRKHPWSPKMTLKRAVWKYVIVTQKMVPLLLSATSDCTRRQLWDSCKVWKIKLFTHCVSHVKNTAITTSLYWLCGAEWRAPVKCSLHTSFNVLQYSLSLYYDIVLLKSLWYLRTNVPLLVVVEWYMLLLHL